MYKLHCNIVKLPKLVFLSNRLEQTQISWENGTVFGDAVQIWSVLRQSITDELLLLIL